MSWRTYVEQVVTGHAGLTGHTGGDQDDLGAVERTLEVLLGVARGLSGRVDVR